MPDSSRRRIREAVVQFLYALGPADELADNPDPAVLTLLLEPLRDKATRARAKAVIHLQQGRERAGASFEPLLHTLAQIEFGDEDGELSRALRSWRKAEEDLGGALESLRHELNGNKDSRRLRESIERARLANRASLAAAARVSASEPHFPALQNLREDALALRKSLAQPARRLELAVGDNPGELPELKALARAEDEIAGTTRRIERYYSGLHHHLPAIDHRLASTVDNYSPDRIDRVDRAILRLGTYELLFDSDVPPAVAIDEAIELARAFGTSDSPRFVNGILDRLAREPAS